MKRFTNRLSPATAIACIALFVSLGGVSYGVATGSIDTREIKNNTIRTQDIRNSHVLTQDIRNSTVRGRDVRNNTLTGADILESSLDKVPSASNADNANNAVNAVNANTSAFDENTTDIASLGATYVTVASTNISTTAASSRVIATGSAEIFGGGADRGQCQIVVDGVASLEYEGSPDDIAVPNAMTIAVTFARVLPAGAHTVLFQCRTDAGAIGKDDAAVAAWSVGA